MFPMLEFAPFGGGELRTELELAHLRAEVAARPLPRHVGIIMDGNGRWAEQRGLPRLEGHRRGSDSVREVTRAARKLGLPALTLYAFSAQNWNRCCATICIASAPRSWRTTFASTPSASSIGFLRAFASRSRSCDATARVMTRWC